MVRLRGRSWIWVTDPHLDHLPHGAAALNFGRALRREHPDSDGLLVTGDIGEADSVTRILDQLAAGFDGQILFVLGNHDYYRSSFSAVDSQVRSWAANSRATWLRTATHGQGSSGCDVDAGIFVVGNSGWYDARYGNEATDLQLTDFREIEELFAAQDDSRRALLETCRRRADELAAGLEAQLKSAGELVRQAGEEQLLCLTHVPPFPEAAWHEGRTSDARWSPFFSSKATGDVLLRFCDDFSDLTLHVLCGHTHGHGHHSPRSNLQVWTGAARYGAPEVAGWLNHGTGSLELRLNEGSIASQR